MKYGESCNYRIISFRKEDVEKVRNACFIQSNMYEVSKKRRLITILMFLSLLPHSQSQQLGGGFFPSVKDLSRLKPITATSTCGFSSKAMDYCISTLSDSSLRTCTKSSCQFGCCLSCGESPPVYVDLDAFSTDSPSGVYVSTDIRPGSNVFSNSREFITGYLSYLAPSVNSNFSFALWIKQRTDKLSVLLEKADVYSIMIQEYKMEITYFTAATLGIPNTIKFINVNFQLNIWNHLAVIVSAHDISLFINGTLERTATLVGLLKEKALKLRIGQNMKGTGQFEGLLQDMKFYEKGLTNREVIEAMTGKLPEIPYTTCRCPETHPRLNENNPFYCMKNGVTSGGQPLKRLSAESHPPEYMVDGGVITYWISEQVNDVTIDIELKYLKLQIYLVSIMFYSPPPTGMKIERSLDFGKSYRAWQYFAVDCMASFNMINDGPLPHPDSVNCLQIRKPKPSWETITFQPAEAGPENRPQRPFGTTGCSDFHCSEKLLQFVQATNVRITLTGHTLVTHPNHRYFGIRRILVGGTCDCYGHGLDCTFDDALQPSPSYKCHCEPRTFTQGDQCQQCQPLYHDKKFARGTILSANPCKKCQCYNHAYSCYYAPELDTDPNDRTKPGGGVCIGCQHNTMGRFCSQCKPLFYRPSGKALEAPDACQACDCVSPGVESGKFDCQKDDSMVGVTAGQCTCKTYAAGRQCTKCRYGYYKLSATNPDGCEACFCNAKGTINNDISCHISSGQCNCKRNVIGLKCTNCKSGFYGLSASNPLGCSSCNCNPLGADLSAICDVVTGQCRCKNRFEGRSCDSCKKGFYGPTCNPCTCSNAGTVGGSSSVCDGDTGQCNCKLYVTGASCDRCKPGYYGLSAGNPSGCSPCNCDVKGTVGNSGQCSDLDSTCNCKSLVTGRTCNLCKVGTYGLSTNKVDGCTKCNCNPRGTVSGDRTLKDELVCTISGQCSCLSNVIGLKCDQCISGYYWNPFGLGCLPCNCDQLGSHSSICNITGYCECKQGDGVSGMKCNECKAGFYGYKNGTCQPCNCSPAGSLTPACDRFGSCLQCKQNVGGFKCNQCKSGTRNLDPANPLGCSGAPSEQAPPVVVSETPRLVVLSWQPPDKANGVVTKYELYRNNTIIYTGLQNIYSDNTVKPYRLYMYYLITYTSGGSTRSVDNLSHITMSDLPEGVQPPVIFEIKDRSVIAAWAIPFMPNGKISHYILRSVTNDGRKAEYYRGLALQHQATGLDPFTVYHFAISVCNTAGCVTSSSVTISTRSAAPDSQPAPYVTSLLGGTSVLVTWDTPTKPNGQIKFYDVYSRTDPFTGEGDSIATKLNPAYRNYTVRNLKPYTFYEFRVVSYTSQVKGSAFSNWTKVRTQEGIPSGISSMSPSATSYSSSTINITWNKPSSPNGQIKRFEIYMYDESTRYQVPYLKASTTYLQLSTQIENLQPYTKYQFSIKACNSAGCTQHSYKITATTKASSPQNQPPPLKVNKNSSSISLAWLNPTILNGPLPLDFIIERMSPPFSAPPPQVTAGIRFPGFGHYQFSGRIVPDSSTTVIEFYFKTRYLDGMIFYASSSNQGDVIVIEFRDGCPWFVFDTESGAAAFTISKNTTFNDNKWHHVYLTRNSRDGTILIDKTFGGSGSGSGSQNIISQITDVFVGGLPNQYRIIRQDYGNMTLKRIPFIGCLKEFKFKDTQLDFTTVLNETNVASLEDYCPDLQPGLYFKGGGYLVLKPGIFKDVKSFRINLKIRTLSRNAPLMFAASSDVFFILHIQNSALILQYKTLSVTKYHVIAENSICDGEWHHIYLKTNGRDLTVLVDGTEKSLAALPIDFYLTSEVFMGGVPTNVKNLDVNILKVLNESNNFAGCLNELTIGTMIYLPSSVDSFHSVDFDGCPYGKGIKTCTDPIREELYDGKQPFVKLTGMQPFTEYLFRVKSYHKGTTGYGISKWVSLRTGDGAPSGLASPTVISKQSRSLKMSWKPPSRSGGLVLYYILHSSQVGGNGKLSTKITNPFPKDDTSIEGTIGNLQPATNYSIKVEAFTSGGSVISDSTLTQTLAAAPEDFNPPSVVSTATTLNISWSPPAKPNGLILFYQVELDGTIKYSGKNLYFHLDGLKVYTKYTVTVSVCGEADCISNTVDVYTGQLSPTGVIAPQLRVLGSKRIEVRWTQPSIINGIIERYEVFTSQSSGTENLKSVFNGSSSTFQTVIYDLTPGTIYYVRLKAYTVAGGTIGDASQARTLESAPENIPTPELISRTSSEITIRVQAPLSPNGVIIQYILYRDGNIILDQSTLPDIFRDSNLKASTKYNFQIKVCTSKGCSFSNILSAYTKDGKPLGAIGLVTYATTSTTVEAKWNAISTPNGEVTYTLYATGEFLKNPKDNFVTIRTTRMCYGGNLTDVKVLCANLLPYTEYELYVNGSNNAGYIISHIVKAKTYMDVPQGVYVPSVISITSTNVILIWQPPARPNGNVKKYSLYGYYPMNFGSRDLQEIKVVEGLMMQYQVIGLMPFTNYSFRIEVENEVGKASSQRKNLMTLEDVPTGLDPPQIISVGSRECTIEISPPIRPNGIIIRYLVYFDAVLRNETKVTVVQIYGLQPYTSYQVHVAACTKVGCVNSTTTSFATYEEAPEGVSAPILTANGSRSVIVRWAKPLSSNGKITRYRVQRRESDTNNLKTLVKLNASLWNIYVDTTVKPFQSYDYLIIAETSAGGTSSPYNTVTTPQGAPDGIAAPILTALSPNSVKVEWKSPTHPNGIITNYFVKASGIVKQVPDISKTGYILDNLLSYVEYAISIRACTVGGCGEGPISLIRTQSSYPRQQSPPTATTISNSSLRVRWKEPDFPNGPIQYYILMARVLENLISENVTSPQPWVVIYQSKATMFVYKNLGIFSLHQFEVTCVTTEGEATSNASLAYRTGPGFPLSGPTVNGTALNHTTVLLQWQDPPIQTLRGISQNYRISYEIVGTAGFYVYGKVYGNVSTVVVRGLRPSTSYNFRVTLFNGAGSKESMAVQVKTLAGTPEGFERPVIYSTGSYDIGVYWKEPSIPNGNIENYTIIANNVRLDTVGGDTTFHRQKGLKPFTEYVIRIEVCTQFSCMISDGAYVETNPAAPANLSAPTVLALSASTIHVSWKPPLNQNGIMIGYEVYRRGYEFCGTDHVPVRKCSYITCKIQEQLCGTTCYDPKVTVCCGNRQFLKDPTKTCCDNNYMVKNAVSDICCGGNFYPKQSSYQCCYGHYRQIPDGHICCQGDSGVIVGIGNSCCGDVPYDVNGTQQCLCNTLYDKYPAVRQCCGGKIISISEKCCSNNEQGTGYIFDKNKICCGTSYINPELTLCCINEVGQHKVHHYPNATAKAIMKCCGLNSVVRSQQCCNSNGYDNATEICSDISSNGITGCGRGNTCPKENRNNAFCDRCNFDTSQYLCTHVNGTFNTSQSSSATDGLCLTSWIEILKNNRDPSRFSLIDENLSSHTIYEYYVVGFNNAGNTTSSASSSKTLMSGPTGLQPPIATPISSTQISIRWLKPSRPNGEILEYLLYRIKWSDKAESLVYRGLQLTYLDINGLSPYTGYMYIVSACTNVCVNRSSATLVYTQQDIPTGLSRPLLTAISSTEIKVNWTVPTNPNGIITQYKLEMLSASGFQTIFANIGEIKTYLVSGLKPFTSYLFRIVACTSVGCTRSVNATMRTLEGRPEGLTAPTLYVNARSVDLEWLPPMVSNGIVKTYAVIRNGTVLARLTQRKYKDESVQPITYYSYVIQVFTSGGSTASPPAIAFIPESSPEGIPIPTLVATSSSVVLVSWVPPSKPNGAITKYSVLYQEEDDSIVEKNVGLLESTSLTNLKTFTQYFVRLKACTVAGCGIGDRGTVTTKEAQPTGLKDPVLTVKSSRIIEISWTYPVIPNGVVSSFRVERKIGIAGLPFIVFVGIGTRYIDTQLQPYTTYEYRVSAGNNAGQVFSRWIAATTLEGIPDNIPAPTINGLNSTHLNVSWNEPGTPNGKLTGYSIRLRRFGEMQDGEVVQCCIGPNTFQYVVGGLEPAQSYEIQIGASTAAGTGYGVWTIITMQEAPPQGVPLLMVNRSSSNDGKSVEVYWNPPNATNGQIAYYELYLDDYVVYRGKERKAIIRRTEPYTNYTFQLVVCNSAGCTKGENQVLTSAEIPPAGQLPPSLGFKNDTVITLRWKKPLFPNGVILMFQIIREEVNVTRKRRSETIISSINITSGESFQFTDSNLKPYTTYRYKVRTFNSKGNIESDWVTITTKEGIPTGLSIVNATAISDSVIQLEWLPPSQPNGIIRYYDVYRNASRVDSIAVTTYVDKSQNLQASTLYKYYILACTTAGCTQTEPVFVTTLPAAPEGMLPPDLSAIDSSNIKADWKAPVKPNGKIIKYQLFLEPNNSPVFEGNAFTYTVSGLETFTTYYFTVAACTQLGCTRSKRSQVQTLEDTPEGLATPNLFSLGANLIEVRWKEPSQPNGVILYYTLLRDNNVIYNGSDTRYIDRDVSPRVTYQYVVTAFNSYGSIQSPIGFGSTSDVGAPGNVSAPTLIILSATAINVTWVRPSERVTKYLVIFGTAEVDVGTYLYYEVINLSPFTKYEFRIKACVLSDCTSSKSTVGYTLEAPPERQAPPYFIKEFQKSTSIRIFWDEPRENNGIIKRYELYRRQDPTNEILIYTGPDNSFTDSGPQILPNTRYEYKVIAFNSVGNVSSSWSVVTTTSSKPEQVQPVEIQSVFATSFSYRINPPLKSNGRIINYVMEVTDENNNLIRNDTLNATTRFGELSSLQPATNYRVMLYACNSEGCNSGPLRNLRTKDAPPDGFSSPPRLLFKTPTTIGLAWEPPTQSSGTISYEIIIHHPCPQASKPKCETFTDRVKVGSAQKYNVTSLTAYTRYVITIQVSNVIGIALSGKLSVLTLPEAPIAVKPLSAKISPSSSNSIIVDWSETFELRSQLEEFVLYENLLVAFSGNNKLSIERTNREVGEYIYRVKAITRINGVLNEVSSGEVIVTVGTAPASAQLSNTEWYETVWFLALCALLFILLVLIIIACCCRGYRKNRTVYVRQRVPLPIKPKLGGSRGPSALEMYDEKLVPEVMFMSTPSKLPLDRRSLSSTPKPTTPSMVKYKNELGSMKESKLNESFMDNDDLIWENYARRDLDSGLYDESPPPLDDDDDDDVFINNSVLKFAHKERIMFPDTHL